MRDRVNDRIGYVDGVGICDRDAHGDRNIDTFVDGVGDGYVDGLQLVHWLGDCVGVGYGNENRVFLGIVLFFFHMDSDVEHDVDLERDDVGHGVELADGDGHRLVDEHVVALGVRVGFGDA